MIGLITLASIFFYQAIAFIRGDEGRGEEQGEGGGDGQVVSFCDANEKDLAQR